MRCRPAGREGRERSARGGKRALRNSGKEAPRGAWEPRDATSAAERRRSPGGRGGMARRLPPRVPSGLPCPPSPLGAGAASSPPRPLARLPCPWSLSPPAPPPSPAEGGSRAWGGARAPPPPPSPSAPVLPGRRARTVPSARLGTRGAAAGPRGAFRRWFGSAPPPPGGLRASAHAGRPPAAAAPRRPPWTVLSRSVGRPLRPCRSPLRVSLLRPTPPPAQASGPGFGSSPSPPLLSPTASRALPARAPASRCSPSPSVARGAWVRGCGEGRGCG